MATPIPLPDLRFESSFRRSLQAKAKQTATANSANSLTADDQDPEAPAPVTAWIVLQVVLKDVMVMPLVQGIAWSAILILSKPWLAAAARHGRAMGVRLYRSLTGFNPKYA